MNLADIREESIILGPEGRKIIRGGKEYPITEEEYLRLHPYHKDMNCQDCTFVPDKKTLLLHFVPRELKDKASRGEGPFAIGSFCLPGFLDNHMEFYLFRCEFCHNVEVSYRYGGGRRLFCEECHVYNRLDVVKYRQFFLDAGLSEEALQHYEREDKFVRKIIRRAFIGRLIKGIIVLSIGALIYYWLKS